jgi:hypothetical protein
MTQQTRSALRAFLQGMTGAGLFRRLDYPGAPQEFVDSRPLEEIRASGEFDQACRSYQEARLAKQRDDARRRAPAEEHAEEEVSLRH